MSQVEWLPHLEGCIPPEISGDRITPYSVALEGWRRGLALKYYSFKSTSKITVRFSLSDQKNDIKFNVSTGPNITSEAKRICKSKILTKQYLEKANVPVPRGKKFVEPMNEEEIVNYANSIGFPVVLKPSNGKMGKGVIPGISNAEELRKSLKQLREDFGYSSVIIEEHVAGEEYRVYVVDGQVIGAINRIPAYIIGDGKSTIRELIREKNKKRAQIPSLRKRPIKIDSEVKKYISKAGYKLNSILNKNEQLFLRRNSNVSSGGEPIDVTDQLPDHIKKIAINASRAIPGLPICGADIMVDKDNNSGAVIELNTTPGIGSHLYPLKGKARDIPKAIIDYYFPETASKDESMSSSNIYFDYPKIENVLKSGIVNEVAVPSAPQNKDYIVKCFIAKGRVQGVNYRKWLQRRAIVLGLDGFAENRTDGSVLIVVAGTEDNVNRFIEIINTDKPARARIKEIKETNWDQPVKVGFEIKGELKNANRVQSSLNVELEKLKEDRAKLQKELDGIKKDKNNIETEHKRMLNSRSWRWIQRVRKVKELLKPKK